MKATRTTPKTKATTKAGQSVLQGAREALAYASGAKRAGYVVHVPAKIDVKAIREKVQMSQEEFARNYGFSKRSLEQWEQGRRTPTGASRAFLAVIAREPEAVHRALLSAGIWIVEGLNLSKIKSGRWDLICLPLRILKGDGAPARAVLRKARDFDMGRF